MFSRGRCPPAGVAWGHPCWGGPRLGPCAGAGGTGLYPLHPRGALSAPAHRPPPGRSWCPGLPRDLCPPLKPVFLVLLMVSVSSPALCRPAPPCRDSSLVQRGHAVPHSRCRIQTLSPTSLSLATLPFWPGQFCCFLPCLLDTMQRFSVTDQPSGGETDTSSPAWGDTVPFHSAALNCLGCALNTQPQLTRLRSWPKKTELVLKRAHNWDWSGQGS